MKNFNDFLNTRKKMSAKEFEANTSSSVETQDFKEGNETTSQNVYVYMDYYYIDINKSKNIGYSPKKPNSFGLLLCNQYFESDNLRELEVQLYNDWFIDNVEGSDEWMYEVGIHTPYQSALYFKMFRDMNLNVEDITYSNDIVDTLRLSWGTMPICDVMLPNSATQDLDNEKHDTFHIEYLDYDGERMENDVWIDDEGVASTLIEGIEELEECLMDWFHQMARNYMKDMVELLGLKIDHPMSLDEFLIEYKDELKMKVKSKRDWDYRGKHIVSLHENFKPLEDWYKFGCEPKNMFDSDNPIYDEEICEDDVRNKLEIARLESRDIRESDDATREFEECQSEVYETNDENEMMVSVARVREFLDGSNDLLIDNLKANVEGFRS